MSKASTSVTRFALALAATMVMGLAATPSAFGASTVTENFGTIEFSAENGKANQVTVTASPTLVTISDSVDTINEALPNCLGTGTNTVVCTPEVGEEFFSVRINLDKFFPADTPNKDTLTASGSINISGNGGNGDDTLTSNGTGRSELSGEEGNDLLNGGPGDDSLIGGGGIDVANGNGGHDSLQGGEGPGDVLNGGEESDVFLGTPGDGGGDQLNGGGGLDTLLYLFVEAGAPPAILVDLNAGTVSATGETDPLSSIEDAITFQGPDTVTGSAGANRIITDLEEEPILGAVSGIGGSIPVDGGDTVNPLGGPDTVRTGNGIDIANLVDGYSDQLDCGPGTDVVQADQLDELIDCEIVTQTTVTPFGSDVTKPSCKLSGVKASYSRSEFLKGLRATVKCNELVTVEGRLTTSGKAKGTKGKGKGKAKSSRASISRAGDLVLAEVSKGGATSVTLNLQPLGRLRSQLGTAFKAKLRIVARDQTGNATVIEQSIKVKPDSGKAKKKK